MSPAHHPRFLRPGWFLPLDGPPVREPLLDLGQWSLVQHPGAGVAGKENEVCELPTTVVLPGLVNAHSHLDLSGFRLESERWKGTFPRWLAGMIRHRRENPAGAPELTQEIVTAGWNETVGWGVTGLGNIVGAPWPEPLRAVAPDPLASIGHRTDFLEVLGLNPTVADARVESLEARCREGEQPVVVRCEPGISPHAPYSIDERLLERTVGLAARFGLPLAMHVAESREERQLLDGAGGELAEVLHECGVVAPDTRFPAIAASLRALARGPRALVVHGNYLLDDELDFIAAQGERFSVVYCPRTHAWFDHEPWPMDRILKRGIRVAIGTDSRASSPDLDLLAELQTVAMLFPELEPRQVLRMGTQDGAVALGWGAFEEHSSRLPYALTGLQFQQAIATDPENAILYLPPSARRRWFPPAGIFRP